MKYYFYLFSVLAALLPVGCNQIPEEPAGPDVPGIQSAQDFIAFAAAVNAGESTEKWQNEEGWVTLLADIDFEGVTEWTPVGHATAPWTSWNPVVTGGKPFTGKFDGNAHKIKNLKLTDAETVDGRHFGIFGYLGPGAIVQNFVIDESCSLTVTSSVSHSAGMIAGVLYDATVRDVTSYAPMTYNGSCKGYLHMALIGGIYAKEIGCIVDSVHNHGAISVTNTENLSGAATGIHAAGVVGFTNAPTGNEKRIVISDSSNNGDMTSQAGRTAGILGAANACTDIIGCENRGNQLNTLPQNDGGRLGNICCLTNNGSTISNCKNYGDLVSTTAGRVGGIVSLPNAGSYTNNENYGKIISDSQYRGLFWGYVTAAAAWEGGKASGKVGKYNGGDYQLDLYPESNKVNYLGKDGSGGKCTVTNVIIDITAAADPQLDAEADFRIFFIGNSFTKDAVEHLPGILNAAGLKKIQMVHMYYGGRTIPEYNDGWATATDYHCYVCNPGQTSWTDITGKSLATVAATGKWDVVTIQEHTGRQLAWGWTQTEKAAVQGLVDKVKAAQTANAGNPKLYYILSQAYHDLSKAQSGDKPFTNTDGMWTVIAEQGRHAVEECGFDGVISTGAMLQNLRTSGINNQMGLTRDGYHMDYGITRYGAACTVFETVIGPFNGDVKLDNNSYRTSANSTTSGSYTTAITDENAPIALKAARYAIAKPYEVTDMDGEGGDPPGPEVEPDNVTIASAADLVAFAARVNSGEAKAVIANVTVTSDIDMSSVTSWTPIGLCVSSLSSNTLVWGTGHPFKGHFNGGGHTIRNWKAVCTNATAGQPWGFFGSLADGAVVENLVFDSSCSLTVSPSAQTDCGLVAGLVHGATVSNIESRATMTYGNATVADNLRMTMALIGMAFATDTEATITGLKNYGTLTVDKCNNTKNNANSVQTAGICGFSSNNGNSTKTVLFKDCVNEGDMTGNNARMSGIVAACNRYTVLKNCINRGNNVNNAPDARLGNLTCITGAGSIIEDSINYGDIISKTAQPAGGCVCLVNHASNMFVRMQNYGRVVTDRTGSYFGTLFGQCNMAASFTTCVAAGDFGKYNNGTYQMVGLTAENYFDYVGTHNASAVNVTKENILFSLEGGTEQPMGPSMPAEWVFNTSNQPVYYTSWTTERKIPATNNASAYITVMRAAANASAAWNIGVASNGVPQAATLAEGDAWVWCMPLEGALPAGSYIDFNATMVSYAKSAKNWVVEILDGDTWKSGTSYICSGVPTGDDYQHSTVMHTFKLTQSVSGELKVRCRVSGSEACDGSTLSASSSDGYSRFAPFGFTGAYVRNFGTQTPADTKKVLCLGNSFSYYNNPVGMLKEIAFAEGHQLDVVANFKGSQTFATIGNLSLAKDAIARGPFDYAFIQGESYEEARYADNPSGNTAIATAVRSLSDQIRAASPSCKVILEATWASTHDNFEGFGDFENYANLLAAGTVSLAEAANDIVSPIGTAFKNVRNGSSGINLYHTDDYHQGPYGAYLKACVNYLVLYKTRFGAHPADCGLDAAKTAILRAAAEEAYFGN